MSAVKSFALILLTLYSCDTVKRVDPSPTTYINFNILDTSFRPTFRDKIIFDSLLQLYQSGYITAIDSAIVDGHVYRVVSDSK